MEIKEVFEPVLNFIRNLQKKDKEPASKQAAKDRLKLVLMQDRASVSPDFFEMMKKEIIDVIKKYIEIDEEALEVELTRGLEAGLEGPALYANIPIKNVKPVAPKASEDGEDNESVETAETTPTVDGEKTKPLSEEEASKVADDILNNIENVATVDKTSDVVETTDVSGDADNAGDDSSEVKKSSENAEIESAKTDDDEKSKATKRKTVRKSTGTKKKVTKATTKKKTEK